MTECPKCGEMFGDISEQRRHVPLCNGSPPDTKQSSGCDRCGESGGHLYPIKNKDGKVVEYWCNTCYDGVG